MWEALREAVDEEMERDPTVCVMGELLSSAALPSSCWCGRTDSRAFVPTGFPTGLAQLCCMVQARPYIRARLSCTCI